MPILSRIPRTIELIGVLNDGYFSKRRENLPVRWIVEQQRERLAGRREILDAFENGLRGYTYFET